ncbi:hypothetical protein QQX98_003749 [Neonectria punicea]|uniref:Uncharacterized protein n=1 Tax=Neonectria punicea TaxID=979145 RepID=A0ABR1HC53_9HYPO
MQSAKLSPVILGSFFDGATTIAGDEHVEGDPSWGAPEGLRGEHSYGDPFSLSEPHVPTGAVRPATVVQVREMVKLANELKVPL